MSVFVGLCDGHAKGKHRIVYEMHASRKGIWCRRHCTRCYKGESISSEEWRRYVDDLVERRAAQESCE